MEKNNISNNGTLHSRIAQTFEGIGLVLVIVVSLFLNIAVCLIIWRNRSLRRTPTNVFVSSLCISSLLMTIFVIPFSITTIIRAKHDTLNAIACEVNGFFSVTSCVSIVLTLCCISIDRYIAVSRPLRYKYIVTVKRAVFALIIVWLQGILCGMLPIWGWSKYKYNPGTLHCSPSWNNCSLYVFSSVVGFVLPIGVMVITYTKIFLIIRKHERKVSTRKWVTKSPTTGKRNLPNKRKTDTLSLSPSSKRQNRNVTFLQNKNRAKVFTVPSSELFYQDGSSYGNYIQKISSRDDYTGCDFSTSFEIGGLNHNSVEDKSRIVFTKDITQHSSEKLAVRTSNTKGTSTRKRFEPNLKLKSIRSRLSAHHGLPREYQVAKTGFFLLIAFLILWAPYLVVHSCTETVQFSSSAFHGAMWCVYMNGIINPVVYALNNRNVKLAFKSVIRKWPAT